MDYMKNFDCNQIKIFINLEIIEEEKLYIYIYIYIFFFKSKNLKKFLQYGGPTTVSKPNFYYIVYDVLW